MAEAATAPTDAAIREYLSGYYEQGGDCDRFKIKSVGPSKEGPLCRDASVYIEYTSGECETVRWTLWLEHDGSRFNVYGEY